MGSGRSPWRGRPSLRRLLGPEAESWSPSGLPGGRRGPPAPESRWWQILRGAVGARGWVSALVILEGSKAAELEATGLVGGLRWAVRGSGAPLAGRWPTAARSCPCGHGKIRSNSGDQILLACAK